MSWMEGRRIRRVRKPTPWQLFVARWHMWIEDTLEKAVCCGVDPTTLADADAKRHAMGGKQASAAFSIRSMSVYLDDSEFGDYEDACDALSDTESESTDDAMSASHTTTIDMDSRCSFGECDDTESRRASVNSEYIPFDDERSNTQIAPRRCSDEKEDSYECNTDDHTEYEPDHVRAPPVEAAVAGYWRLYFNCVLAELLMTSHPVGLWM